MSAGADADYFAAFGYFLHTFGQFVERYQIRASNMSLTEFLRLADIQKEGPFPMLYFFI